MNVTSLLILSLLTSQKDIIISKPAHSTEAYIYPTFINDSSHPPVYNESTWPSRWISMTKGYLVDGHLGYIYRANLKQYENLTESFLCYKIRFKIDNQISDLEWKTEIWHNVSCVNRLPSPPSPALEHNLSVEIILSIIVFILVVVCIGLSYFYYHNYVQ